MTGTDLDVRPDSALSTVLPSGGVQTIVEQYARDLQHCLGLAEAIVETEIVPPSFWPSPAITIGDEVKVLKAWEWDPRRKHPKEAPDDFAARRRAAIATTGGVIHVGATLGHTSYFQSVSGIYFVGGRPALMSEEMRSQVLAKGHHIRVTERTRTRAIVECRRRGEQGPPRSYPFTIEDAEEAGYVPGKGPLAGTDKYGKPKKGGNPKYLSDPATMLVARATTIACRLEFPDVIRGMVSLETAEDDALPVDITATVVDVTPPVARTTTAAILARAATTAPDPQVSEPSAASAAAPLIDEQPPAAAAPEPEIERAVLPAPKALLDVIRGLFEGLGIGGRTNADKAARLAVFSRLLDRTVTAPPELTEDQARMVRDNLIGEAGRALVDEVLAQLQGPPPEAGWWCEECHAEHTGLCPLEPGAGQ